MGATAYGTNTWLRKLEPRYQIVLCCFLATFSAYVERTGFSIAFTAMAKDAGVDEAVKGTVLSAFYWGYGVSQIPGGWLAQIYGGRVMLLVSFMLWSTASFLTPSNGKLITPIIIARIFIGIAQGFLIPSIHTVLSQWIPPHERARATSLSTSGMYLGSAFAMLVLPTLAAAFGPGALLRVVAVVGYGWLALWLLVGRDIPNRETRVPLSDAEQGDAKERSAMRGRPNPTPWLRMATSTAVWAIVISNFSFHYAFYVVMNWLPTYFASLLGSDLAALGPAKTAPYLAMFAASNLGGWAGDWLIISRMWKVGDARKAVNTLGFIASAVSLMLLPAAGGVGSGLVLCTLVLAALGFTRGGFSVNHMDIAPSYAGVLMGISNTAGTLAGVIGVEVTGVVLDLSGGAAQRGGWYAAEAVSSAACLVAMTIFGTFARGERLFD